MLEGIDLLVYDIQDIGVRSYTYIATMGYVMEAAAEQGITVVVLDRPNPLGGRGGRSLFDLVTLQVYRVALPKERLPAPGGIEGLVARLAGPGELPARREREGVVRTRDVRPLVAGVEIVGETEEEVEILLRLRRVGDATARPDEVLRAAGPFPAGEESWWRITRTANLVEHGDTWHTATNLPDEPAGRDRPPSSRK